MYGNNLCLFSLSKIDHYIIALQNKYITLNLIHNIIHSAGQEFRAKILQRFMKQMNVIYSPTQNETKASTSERAIKTIKTKLYRYFTYTEDSVYMPVLQDIAYSYNKTYHRTIGMSPHDVNQENSEEIRMSTHFAQHKKDPEMPKRKRFLYRVGDHVRILHLRTIFTRAYDQTYTGEVFVIAKRYYRGTLPIYRLTDIQNEDIN